MRTADAMFDYDAMVRAFESCDAVRHLAGMPYWQGPPQAEGYALPWHYNRGRQEVFLHVGAQCHGAGPRRATAAASVLALRRGMTGAAPATPTPRPAGDADDLQGMPQIGPEESVACICAHEVGNGVEHGVERAAGARGELAGRRRRGALGLSRPAL